MFLSRRLHLDLFGSLEPWMSHHSIAIISSFHWILNLLFPDMEKSKQSGQCTLKLFRLMRLRHSGHFHLSCIKTGRCNTAEVCRKQLDVVGANYVGTCCAHWICTCTGLMVPSKTFTMKMRTTIPRTANCKCFVGAHAETISSDICSERTSSKWSKLKLKRRLNRSSLPSSVSSLHSFHLVSLPTASAMAGDTGEDAEICRGAGVIPPVQLNWIQF